MTTPRKKPPRARPRSAAESGRIGGLARTPAKRQAARENGKRGGRPRKTPGADVLAQTFAGMPPKLLQAFFAMPEILAENVLAFERQNHAFSQSSTTLARFFLAERQHVGAR